MRMKSCVAQTLGFESLSEHSRISTGMPCRHDCDDITRLGEINAVVWKTAEACLPHGGANAPKVFRCVADRVQNRADLGFELPSETRPLLLIPCNRLCELRPSGLLKANDSAHFQPKRWRMSFRTSSHGTPLFGFFLNSSARRSSSASISGVSTSKSSPSSDQICSATFNCSSRGKVRTCSMISAALMASMYNLLPAAQVRCIL